MSGSRSRTTGSKTLKRHSKPRREFSKIIVCTVGAVTIFVTAFTCVMVWRTSNTDALAYLIPAIFGKPPRRPAFITARQRLKTGSNFAGNTATWSTRRNEPMFEIIIGNLIKIGYAMAIFLCAYLANVVFSCGTTSRSTVNPSAAKAGDRRPERR